MDTRVPNTQLLIDGEWRAAAPAARMPVVNPATGADHRHARLRRAAPTSTARSRPPPRASRPGSRSRAYERSKIMRKAANLLRERIELVATLMTHGAGQDRSPRRKAEIKNGADTIDWFAEEGAAHLRPRRSRRAPKASTSSSSRSRSARSRRSRRGTSRSTRSCASSRPRSPPAARSSSRRRRRRRPRRPS